MKRLILLLFGIILLSGCIGQPVSTPESSEQMAIAACIQKCKDALVIGQELNQGPCLSNEIVKDWVCDVAHSPREAVDNQPENQCSAYREGITKHFVEVDTSCKLIKAV